MIAAVDRGDINWLELCGIFDTFYQHIVKFSDLKSRNKVTLPLSEAQLTSSDYPSFLGLGIIDHDLRGVYSGIPNYVLLIKRCIERGETIDKKHLSPSLLSYENMRHSLLVISYIATGHKRFLLPIETEHIPVLLRIMFTGTLAESHDFDGVSQVTSDVYFSVLQLFKNSRRNLYEAKRARLIPHETHDTIEIKLQESGGCQITTVSDKGTGIPQDKLSLIFGAYTESGTGVGLQAVKRILDLRKGYAEVISTHNGQSFKFDTNTNQSRPTEQMPQGTSAILYFPN